MPLKILMPENITQINVANSEHKHSKIELFLDVKRMNNYFLVAAPLLHYISLSKSKLKRLRPLSNIVNKFSDLHWSVTVISCQY